MDMNNVWDFVYTYYKNYTSSDLIAYADDLSKIMSGEITGDAKRLWNETFGKDINLAIAEYNRVHMEVYESAIEGYLKTLK